MIMIINLKEQDYQTEANGDIIIRTQHDCMADDFRVVKDCLSPAQAIDVTHTGKEIICTPCKFDGSSYIVTKEWGIIKGDITLCSVLPIKHDVVLVSIDNGTLCYRDETGKVYVVSNDGRIGVATDRQIANITWKTAEDLLKSIPLFVKHWTQQSDRVVDRYVANMIFAYMFKSEENLYTFKLVQVNDCLTAPYGLIYEKFEQIDFETEDPDGYEEGEEPDEEPEQEADDFFDEGYSEDDLEDEFGYEEDTDSEDLMG